MVHIQVLRRPTKENVKTEQLISDIKSIWTNMMDPYFEDKDETLPILSVRMLVTILFLAEP